MSCFHALLHVMPEEEIEQSDISKKSAWIYSTQAYGVHIPGIVSWIYDNAFNNPGSTGMWRFAVVLHVLNITK